MKIEVLKKIDYRRNPIYIRRIGNLFEYLIIHKGEIYSNYFDIKPNWFRHRYSEKQLKDIVKLVLMVSYKTIDGLLKKK